VSRPKIAHATFLLFPILAFLTTACLTTKRPEPLKVPPKLDAHHGIQLLHSGQSRKEALQNIFPHIDNYVVSTQVVAAPYGFWNKLLTIFSKNHGKTFLDLAMAAEGMRDVSLRGNQPGSGTHLFDLVARNNSMQVFLAIPPRYLFSGPIPVDGSPFGKRFGVEAWDLIPIFAIGQRLAESEPDWKREDETIVLTPGDSESTKMGLSRVELDSPTELPRTAFWEREKIHWRVDYLAWDLFKNSETMNPGCFHRSS